MTMDWYADLDRTLDQPGDEGVSTTETDPGIWETLEKRIQIAEYQPKRNPQVIEQELVDRSGTYFVLKNTQEKTYLRLSATEHSLWLSMDGETNVQELIVEHFIATGEFAHATVVRLVNMLYGKHMFTDQPVSVWSQVKREINRRTWRFRLSLPAQKMMNQPIGYKGLDKYITLLYKYGGFIFFTRPVQVLLVLISVLGLAAFSQVIRDPNYEFLGSNPLRSIALIWVASLLPIIIHELGHALTVKHFGREVPQGGVMLFFGFPAAFVETTDIWLEPKRARLAVTWNGPYTGLIIGGLAAMFIFLYPSASINNFLFKMLVVAYTTVLFNINPLLKYDGYYLLSDWLEIPSLRERSSAFLRRKFLTKALNRKKFTRDEVVYSVFGILSFMWMAYVLYLMSSVYKSRIQTGIEGLLGTNYSITYRVFSFLVVAGLLSFAFLMGLRLAGVIQGLVIRYSRTGGLQRHGQFALVGAAVAVIAGALLLVALPGQAYWLGPALSILAAAFAAYRLYIITPPYQGSLRGVTYLLITVALVLAAASFILQLVNLNQSFAFWSQYLSVLLVGLGMLLVVTPPQGRLKPWPIFLGASSAAALFAGLFLWADIPLAPAPLSLGLIAMLGIWSVSSLLGGARAPAFLLLGLGAAVLNISWLVEFPYFDLAAIGTLLLAAGGLHLVFANLPQLSSYALDDIPSETHKAIGASVAILVRRVIAQVFFESGYLGVDRLGAEFTGSMQQMGVDISITGNKFQDNEPA